MLLITLIVTSLVACGGGARILGVVPLPSYSHQVVFRPIWRELAKKGHDLVVITTDPENDPSLNIKEIDISLAYDVWIKRNVVKLMEEMKYNIFMKSVMMDIMQEMATKELLHPEVQNLLRNQSEHFDLVVIDYMSVGMSPFPLRFNCPYVGVTTLEPLSVILSQLGNPTHPVAYPDILLGYFGKLNFWQRLISTVTAVVLESLKNLSMFETSQMRQVVNEFFGENVGSLMDLMANVSLLLINDDPAFSTRPLGPNTILFGGGAHLVPAKPLPKDLKEYLDGAHNGFIYFSLGTNVKSDVFLPDKRKIVLDAFRELPYKVLWKFDVTDIPDVPDNVKIATWLPQQDILRHPNIKAFVTQGGLQSTEESIFSHVPMVGIPYIGDQDTNVKKIIVGRECGVYLDKDLLTKESLKEAILEVIDNPKYKQNTIQVSELSRDQPMAGVEKAVWWIEYVIRHKGARHLRNPAMDLPLYQYFFLDVIGFVLLILLVVIYVSYRLFKFIKTRVSRIYSRITKKVKTQ